MSEMADRAREAVRSALKASDPEGYIKEDSTNANVVRLDGWFSIDAIALAVIETMREPTEGMVWSGHLAMEDWRLRPSDPGAVWRAMIGAALAEAPPSECAEPAAESPYGKPGFEIAAEALGITDPLFNPFKEAAKRQGR
jgi:hypothetical protein